MNEETKKNPTPASITTEMKKLVGVQFSKTGKVHSFTAGDHKLKIHELVVVEGDKGPIIGKIIIPSYDKNADKVATNIKKVLRKANPEDMERHRKNREEAMESFHLCQKKIKEHNLPMKLVDVNILAGDAKATFYFTADERIDFRSLVKDLATSLHMRIEMRQIGTRDATKGIGGLGSCGLPCCCATHLREFKSIAIHMAKNQGLSPNPAKLTGMCGKLKCCLIFENEMYSAFKKQLPSVGSKVETPNGMGIVNNLDVPRKLVYVRLEEKNEDVRFNADEVKRIRKKETKKDVPKPSRGKKADVAQKRKTRGK